MERLGPEWAGLMESVTSFLRECLEDEKATTKDKLRIVKEVRQAAPVVFDRAGVPAVKASLLDARVRTYRDYDSQGLLGLIGEKMASLDEGDLRFLAQSNPTIAALLEGAERRQAEAIDVKPKRKRRRGAKVDAR
jgi:hypothetical protein